jgi:hypothetical protein
MAFVSIATTLFLPCTWIDLKHTLSLVLFIWTSHRMRNLGPIFIEDFQGNNKNEVYLTSGDMLFYESSKCIHGRLRRFNGKLVFQCVCSLLSNRLRSRAGRARSEVFPSSCLGRVGSEGSRYREACNVRNFYARTELSRQLVQDNQYGEVAGSVQ